ncbi:MAG TPA: hypothetical protein VFJ82_02545, partial [Longimicrobium sp.]|nr:hypothetical protein [Longimicrobium sp.]
PAPQRAFDAAERRLLTAGRGDAAWLCDAALLAEALWNEALRSGAHLAQQAVRESYRKDPDAPGSVELFMSQEMNFAASSPQRVAAMAERVLTAAERLAELSRQQARGVPGNEFATTAVVRELYTLAWAAVLLNAAHVTRRLGVFAPGDTTEVGAAVGRRAAALLQEPLPGGNPFSPEAAATVDRLLSLTEMVWRTIGVAERAEAAALRQAQLALALKSADAPGERLGALLDALGPTLIRPGLHGLLARVIVASVPDIAQSRRAGYARHAAELAADPALGAVVHADFALYALLLGHAASKTVNPLVTTLMRPDYDGRSHLARLLDETPPTQLDDVFLICLNATGAAAPPELRASVDALLRESLARVPEGTGRSLLQAMLELNEVERSHAEGFTAPATERVLGIVAGLHDSWVYPWALSQLLRAGAPDAELLREAVRQLERDDRDEGFSTYYTLAELLSREQLAHRLTPAERDAVGEYLRRLVHLWEAKASVAATLSVYRYLSRWDAQGAERYRERLEHWEQEQVKEDHQLRFPEMARSGRWFMIFRDCVLRMTYWGIPLDSGDLYPRLTVDPEAHEALMNEWVNAGAQVSAFLPWHTDEIVSTDFVVLGSYLFGPTLGADSHWDADRARFNQEARATLSRLFACMTTLPAVPVSVKEFLRDYNGRFQGEFLAPAGEVARLPA